MSLCCGDQGESCGSAGADGEGAIAEFAVFRGHLAMTDILELENRLMEKHGIVVPSGIEFLRKTKPDVWASTEYERHAHALMAPAPPTPASFTKELDDGVPLRFMARHRSVAWKQFHPVTGRRRRTLRKIGVKLGAPSSSDFSVEGEHG